jgi:hypothetical protein
VRKPEVVFVTGRAVRILPSRAPASPVLIEEDEYAYPPPVRLRRVELDGAPVNDNEGGVS